MEQLDQLLYINRFVAIIKRNSQYFFELNGSFDIDSRGIEFNDNQEKTIRQMVDGLGHTQEELSNIFGKKVFDFFIKNNIIIPSLQDLKKINSRSEAFFQFAHINDSTNRLLHKKIMILGCGSIGTHVSWDLATLGIGKLVLVDCDVVELSNLNRQLLYDVNDIGHKKVIALKDKLTAIAPSVKIHAVHVKITSEKQLEELVKNHACDLIIKAIDSPEELPVWLDHICKKEAVDYISGTLSGTYFVVGPTYIAKTICDGYSDIFPQSFDSEIISATRPSLSCQASQASALIVAEACRVLLNIKNLKYVNRVYFEDVITQNSMSAFSKKLNIELNEDNKYDMNKNVLIIAMIFPILSLLFRFNALIWVGGLFLLFGPVVIFSVPSNAAKGAVINSLWYYVIGFFISIVINRLLNARTELISTITSLLSTFIIYSLILWITTFLAFCLTHFKIKMKQFIYKGVD